MERYIDREDFRALQVVQALKHATVQLGAGRGAMLSAAGLAACTHSLLAIAPAP
ncbi:hypothetical protein LJR039_006103 [Pseudorhodoferax sp. LjRoot39]|uniref:hypothetical protein n=1 Tax=Pseudorhodoferax sp. LjRoot39 TaxID=3342328 RepID=UPI003ECEF325